jgi:mannobiose 2-epimerase
MSVYDLQAWRYEIESELKDNILAFWIQHTVDAKNGGFVGEITSDMQVLIDADKGLVLHARILWTYACAYRVYKKPEYLEMAERAYHYLFEAFLDKSHGGFYWMVNRNGEPVQAKKQIYGQAFVIYALAEYVRAVDNHEARERAISLFGLMEKHSRDPVYGGYIEALGEDWQETDDLRLGSSDMNVKKSMNTHLHVMEAYTNLYRVWQSELLGQRLGELIEITIDHILDDEGRHFKLYFDEDWAVASHEISYGHDIEGSWLLFEAAEVLGDETLIARAEQAAIRMAEATYTDGTDEDGSIFNESEPDGHVDTDKHWWPQAEAVVGFTNAYQLTGEQKYLDAAYGAWRFIDAYLVDKEQGEWYWKTDRVGNPDLIRAKVDPWKCPYHNSRMGFELLERLPKLAAGTTHKKGETNR